MPKDFDSKRAAARANGAKGKGMKTADGLANSARNATTHGLYSESNWVLSTEFQPLFDELLSDFMQRFQPADPVEVRLVEKMVVAHWRQQRIWDMEAASHDREIGRQGNNDPGVWGNDLRSAIAFEAKRQEMRSYARVESHYCHRFESARRALMHLQENRPPARDLRNEANLSLGNPAVAQPILPPVALPGDAHSNINPCLRQRHDPRPQSAPAPKSPEITMAVNSAAPSNSLPPKLAYASHAAAGNRLFAHATSESQAHVRNNLPNRDRAEQYGTALVPAASSPDVPGTHRAPCSAALKPGLLRGRRAPNGTHLDDLPFQGSAPATQT